MKNQMEQKNKKEFMKAIVYEKYGSPDVLELKEVEKPIPKDNEVLIKIHSASINDWDFGLLIGTTFVNRLLFGLMKPKYKILGSDIAGRIKEVGKNVKQFKIDDEVFGDLSGHWGGFAEYVCANEKSLALKPINMTFDEAAAIPQAALLALQGFNDKGQIQSGQKVLINGAGGGAGTFAIQIAKYYGAEVTGVDSSSKLDIMHSIGADHVIDYTKEDFTKNRKQYDFILDNAAYHSIFDCKQALNHNGIYVMVGGSTSQILQIMLLGPLISITGNKKMSILVHKPNKGLAFLKELFEKGKVKPIINRCYPLNEVAKALRYFGKGYAKGKIVITI